MIGLLAFLALQPEAASESPKCNDHRPTYPCLEPEPRRYLPASAARLPALKESALDGVRVTMMSSLGGPGTTFELSLTPDGHARLYAGWFRGHPYAGWRELDRVESRIPVRAYRRLAARIDAALALPDECSPDVIYLDGPDYRIERFANGRMARHRGGMCPVPGSATAFQLAQAFVCEQIHASALPAHFRGDCRLSRQVIDAIIEDYRLDP